jgi:hypothetical protein
MSDYILNSPRTYQLWRYAVGHGQLLLRSTKSADRPTRVDVLFKNVAVLNLPTHFDGISISEASEAEVGKFVNLESELMGTRRLFLVCSENFQGYVIAGAVFSHEDQGEYNDSSFFPILPLDES